MNESGLKTHTHMHAHTKSVAFHIKWHLTRNPDTAVLIFPLNTHEGREKDRTALSAGDKLPAPCQPPGGAALMIAAGTAPQRDLGSQRPGTKERRCADCPPSFVPPLRDLESGLV